MGGCLVQKCCPLSGFELREARSPDRFGEGPDATLPV